MHTEENSFVSICRKVLPCVIVVSMLATFHWGCTKEGPAGPQGPEGSPGTINNLSDPRIQPAVLSTSPSNGATGPFELFDPGENYSKAHFVVVFNKYMTKSSVTTKNVTCQGFDQPVVVRLFQRYRYRIINEIQKRGGLSETASENYDNILEFTIFDSLSGRIMPYRVNRSYSIALDVSLEDINGNHLSQPYRFSYMPEPYFRVSEIYPENGTTGVSSQPSIYVYFNSQIDQSIYPSLQFAPQVVGRWFLSPYDSVSVRFQLAQPLPLNASCLVAVLAGARDRYGNLINAPRSSSFTVTGFKVTSTSPRDGSTQVSPDVYLSVYMSATVDTGSVRQAFSISPPVAGILTPGNYGTIGFRPSESLVTETRYTVTLSTAVRASDGTPLAAPYTFSFTTQKLNVSQVYPEYGSINVERTQSIIVYANSALDSASIRPAFTITPNVSVAITYRQGERSFVVTPTTLLAPSTMYTVTISTALRSRSGGNLESQYQTVFTTRR